MDDLVKRLRAGGILKNLRNEAADRIETIERENAKLRERVAAMETVARKVLDLGEQMESGDPMVATIMLSEVVKDAEKALDQKDRTVPAGADEPETPN